MNPVNPNTLKAKQRPGDLLPPEGVPLKFQTAGLGVRFSAQLIDIVITSIAAAGILVLLSSMGLTGAATSVGALLFLIIRVPYYILSELAWNGQTLGKRFLKIKVVSHDGRALSTHALVLRNLMKEAEVFLPGTLLLTLTSSSPLYSWTAFGWIVMTLMIPLMNKHRRRLGDLMAGTHVIHLPVPLLLRDLADEKVARAGKQSRYTFQSHQLDHYGAFELQTLEMLLRAEDAADKKGLQSSQAATLETVVEKVRRRTGYADPVAKTDHVDFLRAFYQAQREHLEQRQIFGEKRKDKHYAKAKQDP